MEEDTGCIFACQCLGDVETTHTAETMFLLEEEEGMRLHDELAANLVVTINYNGMDAQLFQGFTASQTSRTRTNDGHIRTIGVLVPLHCSSSR